MLERVKGYYLMWVARNGSAPAMSNPGSYAMMYTVRFIREKS